jgi:dTDP-4-dehydrorhamnose reductase
VYLSSIAVFDGAAPYPKQEDLPSPATEYGRQRVETEELLGRMGESVAIVRFSRILGSQEPLFAAWTKSLNKGEAIHPFSDMKMAPVPVNCAISVLRLVADQRLAGTLQVSGNRDISYADAAELGASVLGADPSLVQPRLASEADEVPAWLPRYTTMNIDRLKATLGIEPPDVSWTVQSSFTQLQVMAPLGA